MKTLVSAVAEPGRRIPRSALFCAAAFLQFALLAVMVADRAEILRDGTEVVLRARPVDPRDILRGDYVTLDYDISRLPAGPLEGAPAGARNPVVFVKLAPGSDGTYQAVSVHADAVEVTSPEVLIRGRVEFGAECDVKQPRFCKTLRIRYNLESYFVPEGGGSKLERLRNERRVAVVAAVDPAGRAAIKRLLVDGEAVYDEPWF